MDRYLTIISTIVYIEDHVREPIDGEALARAVGFSLAHLRDVFVRAMGRTLARYVLERRIANAAFALLHTDASIADIAQDWGFESHDSFARAFRRVTGRTPSAHRRARSPMAHVKLCAGVYGVGWTAHHHGEEFDMDHASKRANDEGTVLYGVPKVHYGAYGGCTPLPICLKACANYLGDDLEYDEIMVTSAAAFRLTWDTTCWNGGNVDIGHAFDDPVRSYETGLRALGRRYEMLWRRPDTTKDAFVAFLRRRIGAGAPVIALGIIGPPEACLVTGVRGDGPALLGWNLFQDSPEFRGGARIDESGYFITDEWWENRDTIALFGIGERCGDRFPMREVLTNAAEVLRGRRDGDYAKGILAYDAWRDALADDAQFPDDAVMQLLAERIMAHGDAIDCLADGRHRASRYFAKRAEAGGDDAERFARIGAHFGATAAVVNRMMGALGGWERGEAQTRRLAERDVRRRLCAMIDEAKAHDGEALAAIEAML